MMYVSNRMILVLVFVVSAIAGGAFLAARTETVAAGTTAQEIVRACAKSEGDPSACYEATVPDLYPKLSVPQIFDVVRAIRAQDQSYQFCHVLAHKVGERVVAEDPNGWVNAIPLNPFDGLCSNGYIHGVVGGRFRSEVLDDKTFEKFLPDFILACKAHNGWQPSDLDRAICYHGMGHLFVFITDAELPKALTYCSRVAPPEYQRVCIQGVFMQIYQPLEPDDYALIERMQVKPTVSTVRAFCAAYKEPIYVGSCLEESWPLFREEIVDGTGVTKFCSGQPDATETKQCYVSASSIIGRMQLGKPDKAAAACAHFPSQWQETCFSFSAQAVLEESLTDSQKAIALCEKASPEVAHSCVSDLVDRARFTFGSNTELFTKFCANVPESLRASCNASI